MEDRENSLVLIAADTPHSKPVYWVLEQVRVHSIEKASANIKVASLEDPSLLLSGGADYNDMCSSCHLQPGQKESDMSIGLYPAPPNLAIKEQQYANKVAAARGITHDDQRIWAMVAFLEKLPELTAEQYQILTARE